jgi:hypothetical protein
MTQPNRIATLFDWLWLLAWGTASSIWCLTAAHQLGATFDEPFYVSEGLEFWRTGSHSELLRLGTMPLPVDVETLPLSVWERWRGEWFDADADLARLLPVARAGTLVFWWLLLFYGRLAGRALAGPWGGRLAVAMLAAEPCLLANAGLATTDLAVTACLLAFAYHFQGGRGARWWKRVGIPALWFGLAVLAKASAIAFAPLCMVAIEWDRLWRGDGSEAVGWWARLRTLLRDGWQIGALGIVLTFVACGSDWQPQASFLAWAQRLPDGTFGRAMVWLAEHLRIFRNAGDALARQTSHNVRGHGVFLLGESDPRAVWYYFPVLLTIKLSLPLLAAPGVVALVNRRSLVNWACAAAAVLLVFSVFCRVQIGIRLLLPLVALTIVGLGAGAVQAWQSAGTVGKRGLAAVVTLGLVWTAGSAAWVWPDGLCYTNEFWGGTSRGYLCASEANYDWGQGLKELERWRRETHVGDLDVWYFGTDPELKRLPMRPLPLHTIPAATTDEVLDRLRGKRLAVGTTLLYGVMPTSASHQAALDLLRSCRPVDRTATFLIYDFTPGPDGRPISLPGTYPQNNTAARN